MAQGYSLAFGARFLKRMIDERIKLPISATGRTVRTSRSRSETANWSSMLRGATGRADSTLAYDVA